MRRIFTSTKVVLIFLLLLTAGCKDKAIKVGVVLPESGEDQSFGESSRRGIELAQQTLADSGTTFELFFADSASDASQAASELTRLLDDTKVLAAIGGVTPREARAMAPVAEQRERVLLSPSSTDDGLAEAHRHFYRLAPSDFTTGSTFAAFAHNRMNIQKAVVITETAADAERLESGFRPAFESNGGEMLERIDMAELGDQLPATIEALNTEQVGAVLLTGRKTWITEAIRGLRQGGYKGRLLTNQGLVVGDTIQELGDVAAGVLIAHSPFDPSGQSEQLTSFFELYRSTYGEDPDIYAAEAYDTLQVLAAAMAGRPALPAKVRDGLRDEIKGLPGVTGSLQFDDTGSVTTYARIYSVSKDLSLRDHAAWMEEEERKLQERKKAILDKMKALEERAAAAAGSP